MVLQNYNQVVIINWYISHVPLKWGWAIASVFQLMTEIKAERSVQIIYGAWTDVGKFQNCNSNYATLQACHSPMIFEKMPSDNQLGN